MMLNFTVADLVAFFAYMALLYAGAPLAVLATGLLLVPACRRITLLRWTAWGLLALIGLLCVCAVPMLSEAWSEHEQQATFARDTHHLTAPQVLSGISFPARSTVHVNSSNGHVEFGSVPVPTAIAGLMLVGDFRLERRDMDDYTITFGTLAVPTVVHGIPCSRGALIAQENTTRCILDRDFDFAGHMIARGAGIEIYRSPLDEPAVLQWGTRAAGTAVRCCLARRHRDRRRDFVVARPHGAWRRSPRHVRDVHRKGHSAAAGRGGAASDYGNDNRWRPAAALPGLQHFSCPTRRDRPTIIVDCDDAPETCRRSETAVAREASRRG